ncbi:MAG: DUF4340 domain-containing protein [Oscillospiraceae bacterium]|jgi:hypothetical protein|nr:DUF4340 domain-containing protein [Oscillospiraceae bacterium]
MDENERKDVPIEEDKPLFSSDVKNLKDTRAAGGKGGRLRGLIWAVAALALAGGVYAASIFLKPAPVETDQTPTVTTAPSYLLVDKTKADFVSATVEVPGQQTYTMAYDGEAYAIEGMPRFSLDQTKANSLSTSCTYLYVSDIEDNPEDLSIYGLDQPKAKVTARYNDGSSRVFLLGEEAPSGYRYYFKEESSPKVYTVYSSTGERYTATLASMHTLPTWTIAYQDIQYVKLERRGDYTVEIRPAPEDTIGISLLELVQPFRYEADSERMTELFTNTAALTLAGFEADPLPETLSLYGLDEPRYTLDAANADNTPLIHLEVGNPKNDAQTYVRVADDEAVYLMDSSLLAFLPNVTAPMLVDRFANIINIAKVDAIDINGMGLDEQAAISRSPSFKDDGTPRLDGNGNQMNDDTFTLNGEPVDDTQFRKLYQIIIGTRVDGVIPEGKAPDPRTAALLTVRYQLSGDYGTQTIEYLPYDADYYAVRRNGETLFYILKSRVRMIPDALSEYHAGTFDPKKYGV